MCSSTCAAVTVLLLAIGAFVARQRALNVGGPHNFGSATTTADVADALRLGPRALAGRRVLVTGARRGGLGFETCRALLAVGAGELQLSSLKVK